MRFCASTTAKIEMMSMKVNGAVFLSNMLASGTLESCHDLGLEKGSLIK